MQKRIPHESGLVLLFFVGISLVMTWPLVSTIFSVIPGDGGDARMFVWNLWWVNHALLTLQQNPFQTDYIFCPVGVSLVFHTLAPLYGIVSIPLQAVFSPVFCYNCIFLLTFILTGWGTYKLSRTMGTGLWGALLAGFAFTFCPVRMARALGHLNLLSTQWIPLFYVFLVLALLTRQRRYSVGAGLMLTAAVYSSYQLTVMLGISLIINFLVLGLSLMVKKRTEHTPPSHNHTSLRDIVQHYLIVGAVCLILVSPLVWLAAAEFSWEGNYVSEYSQSESFKTDLVYYLNPFHETLLVKKLGLIRDMDFWAGTEKILSPGFMTLLLAGLGLFFIGSTPRVGPYYLFWGAVVIVFFLLSLGSSLLIGGVDTGISLPYKWFREVPLLGGVRVPGKLSLMVALGLSIFAGLGFQGLLRSRSRVLMPLGILFVCFMFLEYASFNFPVQAVELPKGSPLVQNRAGEVALADQSGKGLIPGHDYAGKVLKIMQIPFGLDTGFRKIGRDISQRSMLEQVFHEHIIHSGHVSRCPEAVLEYFKTNPLLGRIAELQASKPARALMVPAELLRGIAREWLYLTQLDRIEVVRYDDPKAFLTQEQFNRLNRFVHRNFPVHEMSGQVDRMVFSFQPALQKDKTIEFSDHPENNVYIFNTFLLDQTEKFSKAAQVRTWNYFRLLFPSEPGLSNYVTLHYRGYPEWADTDARLDVFLNRSKIAEIPYPNEWKLRTIVVPQNLVRRGTNTLQLTYNRKRTMRSGAGQGIPFSIGLVSAGWDHNNQGSSQINIAHTDYSFHRRGFNVAYIDPDKGKVIRAKVYDTCEFEAESNRLASDIEKIAPGTIVAAVVHDDASNKYNHRLEAALQSLGTELSLRRKFRYAYAFIGVKGWQPGQALEKMDENFVFLTNGNGAIGVRSISFHHGPVVGQQH